MLIVLVVASTIGRKTRISLFDDESEPCSGSERNDATEIPLSYAQVRNHERHLVTRALQAAPRRRARRAARSHCLIAAWVWAICVTHRRPTVALTTPHLLPARGRT